MSASNGGGAEPQKSQTELEREAGRRAAARYRSAPPMPPKNANGTADSAPLFDPSKRIETGLEDEEKQPPIAAARTHRADPSSDAPGQAQAQHAGEPRLNSNPGTPSGTLMPSVDHGVAIQFYNALRPDAFILDYKQGRRITSAGEFEALTDEADRIRKHLFFHVTTVKSTWDGVTTATKDQILECPYLWGDCDAEKYAGGDPVEAAQHYASEGVRVRSAIAEGLNRLGITPYALWRSGAGWQFLIKLDRAVQPEEAETLVGKLHTALGFDPVVRNCNRILRVPGSVNWKNGTNGRVPSPCVPLSITDAVTTIDDVRKALAIVADPENDTKANGGGTDIKIDWSNVKQPGWLKSVADLPDDAPQKIRIIVGHTGTLKELNTDLIEHGLITKGYGSWSDVTYALAAAFKSYGRHTLEEIAEALLVDLPCNQHVNRQPDKRRTIERAIARSHKSRPNANIASHWPGGQDDETGKPLKGILNTIEAIKRSDITCTWDEFRQKEYWFGHEDKKFNGEVSDAAVTVTRVTICTKFRLYPKIEETREAITYACHYNKTNPVLDYFNRLKWDGKPRLDRMLPNYLGADDTPLNAGIGRKMMCAIVRRAKQPGCKFDHQPVLQSPQGRKKSMFCEDLAVSPDLYTDAGDLSGTIKEQMEIIQGKQIIEFPELAGYSRATREHNKAMLSRKVDRARLSYAHYATDAPRSSIPLATTNEDHYLNDPTGERRYWHVAVRFYDREAFFRDKDQLYAEAVAREPNESLWLDTFELVAAHDAIVANAKEPNELVDLLADLHGEAWHVDGKDEERVSTADIRAHLGMKPADAVRAHNTGRRIFDASEQLMYAKCPLMQ